MVRFFLCLILLLQTVLSFAEKVTIESDKIYTIDNTTYAEGSVLILYSDMVVTSDNATYFKDINVVELSGNVVYKDKENIIRGSFARINLDNKSGYFEKGKGFYAPWSYFSADKLEKLEGNTFLLDNATISACSGDVPDWSFSANKARIDLGQYFRAKHSFGNLKNVPVAYFPYFVWPIKKDRESGFLVPQFGFSSTKGLFITPKYFWAMDVDKDMTTGVNLFTNNGAMILNEFRYAVSKKENIHLIGEFIDDRDSEADKSSRWRLYGVGNKFIADNLEFKFNINYASDFRYKRDFKDYNMVDKLPGMDPDKNEYIAELRLNYYTKYSDLSIRYKDSMQYYDYTDNYRKDNLYQKPNIQAEKYGIDLRYIKLDYLADYNSVEKKSMTFYSENNKTKNVFSYDRYNTKVKLYKPFNLKIATFTPFYTQYITYWRNFDYKLNKTDIQETSLHKIETDEDSANRYIYSIGYGLSLNEIYKNYTIFRHSIYNTFEYIQTPRLDQSALPNNIDYDQISQEKMYRYTMTNYFRSDNVSIKFEVIQGYDQTLNDDKFSPIHTKLNLTYAKWLSFDLENKYNYYTSKIDYYKKAATINYDNYYLSYTQSFDKAITSGDNENAGLKFGGKFEKFDFEVYKKLGSANNNFKFSPFDLNSREFYLKILYKSECWNLGFLYKQDDYLDLTKTGSDKKREKVIFILLELKGIGGTQREVYRN
ncbi:LPS-assembly protein LptD [Calditerrivibrio sp.]|uniref:LPS-assembly protein LptD n=1 Tax=Calditerrivibrio sp. TaxID=2792612 RepID=UPI003D0C5DD1